jgi:methylmalonyl-CoA mutase cobalamin-binding domain/chain
MGELRVEQLADFVIKGDITGAVALTEKLLEAKIPRDHIIERGLLPGLKKVGEGFEGGELFLPELFSAGELAKQVCDLVRPYAKPGEASEKGTIVIGTVHGDVHDIGMNLVAANLEGAGYDVINLGSNVPAEDFVDAVKKHDADLLAMSSLLTTTMPYMKTVVAALTESGLREKVKVLVGGAPLDEAFAMKIGADGYGKDPADGLRKVETLLS